jgi:hypothetical protein
MAEAQDALEESVKGEARNMPPSKLRCNLIVADLAKQFRREVCVLSPEPRPVEFLEREGVLQTARVLTTGPLSPKRFPSLSVEVSSIWPD